MRWETPLWMSVVLVVTTTALHLTVEHGLYIDPTSPPALEINTKQSIVRIASDSEEIVVSAKNKDEESDHTPVQKFTRNLIIRDPSFSLTKFLKKDKPVKLDSDSDSNNFEKSSKSSSQTSESDEKENKSSESSGSEPSVSNENNPGGASTEEETDNPPETEGSGSVNEGDSNPAGPPETGGTIPDNLGDKSTTNSPQPEDNGTGNEEGPVTTSPQKPDDTIVETSSGRVHGHVWRGNTNIISYIDIKYGTFNNLFEAPVFPEANEESVHDEKVHSKRCPQLQGDKTVGVLDCLTLSIFKPWKAELSGASVLVHIHEGNFINESADPEIYGPEYLVSEEIILVLPNYRLGPLGFLCLQNETAPGNAALKDLALALSWIKKNIEKFGGDPENIAVSAEGTAGALAGYLALSPMSKSNINKVITESGSVLSDWAIDRNPIVSATDLTHALTGSWESWETIEMEALLLAARNIVWRPCLENKTDNGVHFMVDNPWTILHKEGINVTFMMGSANYAGVHESLNHTEDTIQQLNANFSLLLPNDLVFKTNEERIGVANKVKAQYFGEAAITLDNVENRTLYYTDVSYLGPVIRTARCLVNAGCTVYFYEFSFVGDLNRELAAIQKQVDGAVRGDIIGYLFYQDGEMPAEGTKERNMIEQLIQFWTSFLKTGVPKADDVEWTKFEKATAAQEQWLSIGAETTMTTGLHVDRLSLWTDIYNEHFIHKNLSLGISPSVYTVLFVQVVFFISFFRNVWHFF